MICTFGDATDIVWWRELKLPVRAIIGRNGRLTPVDWGEPGWRVGTPSGAQSPTTSSPARTAKQAQRRIVELLVESGELLGEPRPITHPVKFYEKGDRPLEIVTSRQWFVKTLDYRDEFLARGEEIALVTRRTCGSVTRPGFAASTRDWCISRQRFFGVPFPVWYPVREDGEVDYCRADRAAERRLPIDPSADAPQGFDETQRGEPGGFVGDPDVMDTWATSSLTPADRGRLVRGGRPVRAGLPDGPAATGARDHSHLAVLDRRALALRARLPALDPRGDLRLGPRSGPQEDVEVEGQRRHADGAARPVRLRCGPLLGGVSARLGVDTAFDEGQLRIGRKLAIKILNAAKFVLFQLEDDADDEGDVTAPLDRSMLACARRTGGEDDPRLRDVRAGARPRARRRSSSGVSATTISNWSRIAGTATRARRPKGRRIELSRLLFQLNSDSLLPIYRS